MNRDFIIGIDCGANGAVCFMRGGASHIFLYRQNDPVVIQELAALVQLTAHGYTYGIFIENIDARRRFPKANIQSMRKLSENFGYWVGALSGMGLDYELVEAKTWQSVCGGLQRGDYDYNARKTHLWKRAETLYPNVKIPKYAADAVLIAHYGTMRT